MPSITQEGITVTYDGGNPEAPFANGDIGIGVGAGTLRITSIEPASVKVSGRAMNGAMINPDPTPHIQDSGGNWVPWNGVGDPPQGNQNVHGYDSLARYNVYQEDLNVALNVSESNPLLVPAGSSIVFSRTNPTPQNRPQLDAAFVLTVLDTAPSSGDFRPPYCGTDKTLQFNTSDLHRDRLKSLARQPGTPSTSSVEAMFEGVWLDHGTNFMFRELHPAANMPDYGRDMSNQIGIAAVLLNSDLPLAEKETLLIRFVQLGIDLMGIIENGGHKNLIHNGGHCAGRKAPILIAGHLLDDASMSAIGTRSDTWFQEDMQTFYVRETSPGIFNNGYGDYIAADKDIPEWGIEHVLEPERDTRIATTRYRRCCTATTWSGWALAIHAMGLRSLWNHEPLFDYIDRYIQWMRDRQEERYIIVWDEWVEDMWDAHREGLNYHPLVAQNLAYLEENMTWESEKIFALRKPWKPTGVLLEDADKYDWEEAYFMRPDGRGLRLSIRIEIGGSTPHIDFWWRYLFGHTSTSKVNWNAQEAGGVGAGPTDSTIILPPVKLGSENALEMNGGRAIHIGQWLGHGQAPVESGRITFSAVGVWASSDIVAPTVHRPGPPFARAPKVPTYVNINDAFDTEKAKEASVASRTNFGDKQTYAPPGLGDTGAQGFLGGYHGGLDYAADRGNEREPVLRRLLSANSFRPYHFIEPDGTVWRADDSRWNLLAQNPSNPFNPSSRGWSSTLGRGQNWFVPPAGQQWSWMSRSSGNIKWENNNFEHPQLGTFIAAQLDRHRDVGLYWEALHLIQGEMSQFPVTSRGPSPLSSMRGWGRTLSSKTALYHVLITEEIETHMHGILDFMVSYWDSVGRKPKLRVKTGPASTETGSYAAWEVGIWVGGIYNALTIPNLGTARTAAVEQVMFELAMFTLVAFHRWNPTTRQWDENGTQWQMPYLVGPNGAPWPNHSQPTSALEWGYQAVQVLRFLFMSRLSSGDQAKVKGILAQLDAEVRAADEWPSTMEYLLPDPEGFVQPETPIIEIEAPAGHALCYAWRWRRQRAGHCRPGAARNTGHRDRGPARHAFRGPNSRTLPRAARDAGH